MSDADAASANTPAVMIRESFSMRLIVGASASKGERVGLAVTLSVLFEVRDFGIAEFHADAEARAGRVRLFLVHRPRDARRQADAAVRVGQPDFDLLIRAQHRL